jgi:hypothetical protein
MQGTAESILDQEQVYETPEEMGDEGCGKPKPKTTAEPPPPLPDGPPK